MRSEGANHQWRKDPLGELSIDPVADERLARVTAWAGASLQRSPIVFGVLFLSFWLPLISEPTPRFAVLTLAATPVL